MALIPGIQRVVVNLVSHRTRFFIIDAVLGNVSLFIAMYPSTTLLCKKGLICNVCIVTRIIAFRMAIIAPLVEAISNTVLPLT